MALTDNYFDTYAWDPRYPDRSYDATWRDYGFHVFERYLSDLQRCRLAPPRSVLDIGAANGLVIQELLSRGINARGIEQSRTMYERAAPDIRWRIQCGDARKLIHDVPDERYDTVYETIAQYIPLDSIPGYLAQVHRVVRQDVVFLVHTVDMSEKPHHEQVTHILDDEWRELFRAAGFVDAGEPGDHPYWFTKA